MSNKHKTSSEDLRRVGGTSTSTRTRREPWAGFVEQIERVKPHLGHLSKSIETMKHPKRDPDRRCSDHSRTTGRWRTTRVIAFSTPSRAGPAKAACAFTGGYAR